MKGKPLSSAMPWTRKHHRVESPDPEEIAIRLFGALVADEDRGRRFLALTGLSADTVRAAAGDRSFLANVVDYVAADERLLLAMADQCGLHPRDIAEAASRLSPRSSESEPS